MYFIGSSAASPDVDSRIAVVRRALAVSLVALSAGVAGLNGAAAEPLRADNPAIAGDSKKNYPELEEAQRKLLRQDADAALEAFKAAAKAHPDLPSGRILMAKSYFGLSRPREARAQLEKAVVENPDDPEPYLVMTELALREAQWTEAGLLSNKALALAQAIKGENEKKKDLLKRAYMGAAASAQNHDDWESAQKLLAALLKVAPDYGFGHFRMGQVLFELGKKNEAYAELQAAARMAEDIPSPEATMGRLYDKVKDRENAETWMNKAVTADPKGLKTRLEVAQWMLSVGKLEEAKAQVVEALKIDPSSQDALFLAGRIARCAKEFRQAQKYIEKAYIESPGAVNVANELALTLVELGEDDRQRALALAQATYRQARDAETAATFGWILYRLGRLDEAEQALNAVLQTNQVAPDAIYYFATLAEARNRGEAVKPLLEAALKSEGMFAYRQEAQKLLDRLTRVASKKTADPEPETPDADKPKPQTTKTTGSKSAGTKSDSTKGAPKGGAKGEATKSEGAKGAKP